MWGKVWNWLKALFVKAEPVIKEAAVVAAEAELTKLGK